jgi:DNA-binding transcriptional ArsR family regulator
MIRTSFAARGGRSPVERGDRRVTGATHPAAMRLTARGRAHYLRVCANTDIFEVVLDYLPVSAELDRERYAAVGRALADPKRLCVLESLAIGELSVSDLSTRVGCQVPNMSQHLAVLRRAGLVTSRRDGNTILYRLADHRVLEAYRLIQDIAR